jgi:peptidoglycan/LPS O-acetylase OafA/YrhL
MAIHRVESMGPLNPTWTLAVEEQFYLAIPALIYFAKPQRLVPILASGILLAPLIRLAIFLVDPQPKMAIFVLLPCRMDALLLGVAAAYYLRQKGTWEMLCAHRRALWAIIEVLTLIYALILVRLSPGDPSTMFTRVLEFECLDFLYFCILLASLVDERLAGVLRARWLMGLGNIAYGVYLLNLFVFWMVVIPLSGRSNRGAIAAIVALILTIVIAKISWECFEKPLIRMGHKEGYQTPELVD